jgi:S1-C subfamily serine protease
MPGLNLVDVLLVLGLLSAAVRGYQHGALAQVAAFAGLTGGLLVGAAVAPNLASRLVGEPGTSLALLTLGLLVTSMLVGQAVGAVIGRRLSTAVHSAGAGGLDRAAGTAVSVVSLLLVIWLAGAALAQGPLPILARQVTQSRVVAAVSEALPPAPDLISRVGTYLSRQGFPQVFSGVGGVATAPPIAPPGDAAVAAAQAAASASTVQVTALGCEGVSAGSGFVTAPGFVVTNAHVVAGGEALEVRDGGGVHQATAVHFDPALDLAVLAAPGTTAAPIAFADTPADRGVVGATLGFPGGQPQLVVKPAAVGGRGEAVGRDIYGRGLVSREILTLSAAVRQGDSGGPFVTSDGRVGGVVFAAAATDPGTGYALTAERVRGDIASAVATGAPVSTGACRF